MLRVPVLSPVSRDGVSFAAAVIVSRRSTRGDATLGRCLAALREQNPLFVKTETAQIQWVRGLLQGDGDTNVRLRTRAQTDIGFGPHKAARLSGCERGGPASANPRLAQVTR